MTVQAATRMWSRHGGAVSTPDGRKLKASIKESYQVVADPTDTIGQVEVATGLPAINQLYPGTTNLRVVSYQINQQSPVLWQVDVTYGGDWQNPIAEAPEIIWGKVTSTEPVDQDRDGKAIVTVNNEPIEGVTKELSDLTVKIKRNFLAISMPATYQYLHSVNSDTFLGFAPGVCRMTEFSAREVYASGSGSGYYEVTAGFTFRWPYQTTPDKAWYTRLRHEGYYVKRSTDSKKIRACDANCEKMDKPVLLKADGTEETDPANAHWLEIPIYTPLPYNSLGLL